MADNNPERHAKINALQKKFHEAREANSKIDRKEKPIEKAKAVAKLIETRELFLESVFDRGGKKIDGKVMISRDEIEKASALLLKVMKDDRRAGFPLTIPPKKAVIFDAENDTPAKALAEAFNLIHGGPNDKGGVKSPDNASVEEIATRLHHFGLKIDPAIKLIEPEKKQVSTSPLIPSVTPDFNKGKVLKPNTPTHSV